MKWSVIGWNQRMKNQKLISNSESKFKNRNRLLDNLPCFKNNILITAPIKKGEGMKINKVMEDNGMRNDTWDNLELENITYYHCHWENMQFNNVTFKGCMFSQNIFANCKLKNCTFIECRFIKNVYKGVELKDVKIEGLTDNLTLACEVDKK